ncbi:MAG TPA: hypothetical protein DC024_06305 [Clostridiales bacterium]|jgi:hypothetical protein|nr:hypothetical protein [Clostridiales bacterium]
MRFKTIGALLVIVSIVFTAFPVGATTVGGAFSGFKKINHNGSYSYTSFDVYIYFTNLINKARHTGTSTTAWLGSNPSNADSVVHKNIITVTGIGGLSATGLSISGNQATDTMTVTNYWRIVSNFDYTVRVAVAMFSTNFGTHGRVQIGSNFYSVSTST